MNGQVSPEKGLKAQKKCIFAINIVSQRCEKVKFGMIYEAS